MPKLFPENQPPINQEFINTFLKLYGLSATSYELPKGGIENATIIATTPKGKFVLRIYRKNNKTTNEIKSEISFMEYLGKNGIPVPGVIRALNHEIVVEVYIAGDVWQAIAMDYIGGTHDVRFDGKVMEQLAALQAKIHNLGEEFAPKPAKSLHALRENIFYKPLQEKQINNPEIRSLLDRIGQYEVKLDPTLPKGWGHFDFDPDNILFDEAHNVKAVLDFDDAKYMPLVICLGYTLWDLFITTQDSSKLVKYIDIYEKERILTTAEKKVLPEIILFRHYVVSSVDLLFGRDQAGSEAEILEQEKAIKKLSFT